MGNEFAEKYNSQIDTADYTWLDSFSNNLLVRREYPKYGGQTLRIEEYEYYENNDPKKTIITSSLYGREIKESIVYLKTNKNTTEITKYGNTEESLKEIHRKSNDTLYIDHIINGKNSFTAREFWETDLRKQDQIIRPEMDEVMNTYIHNENGDLIKIERFENGQFVEVSMSLKYNYDSYNRILLKETYYGNSDKSEIGMNEVTIYN